MSNITSDELKELEGYVMKYLTTRRGCKHYRAFELVYALIEKYKYKRNSLNRITEEIDKLTA